MTRRADLADRLDDLRENHLDWLQEDGLACNDCGAPFYGPNRVKAAVPVFSVMIPGAANPYRCAPGHGCHTDPVGDTSPVADTEEASSATSQPDPASRSASNPEKDER